MSSYRHPSHMGRLFMKRFALLLFMCASPLFGQSNRGELRLKVTDPAGLGVKVTVQIVSEANQYRNTLATSDQGYLDVQRLPFGTYQVEIDQSGFAAVAENLNILSSIPIDRTIQLKLLQLNQSVLVSAGNTLINT